MANIIIPTDERRAQAERILRDFGHGGNHVPAEHREAADCIAYRTGEINREMQRMEDKRR